MFRTRMSITCAETLSSFLITAAERFSEDAKVCRECKTPSGGHESLAQQFDKQARQARKLAEQFSEAYTNYPPDQAAVIEAGS